MKKKNDYSFSLDSIQHGTAHYSKNWSRQDQNEYNHKYYQEHKEKWGQKAKSALSSAKDAATKGLDAAGETALDTTYDLMTGEVYATYPGTRTLNNLTGVMDVGFKYIAQGNPMYTKVIDHHLEEHTVLGKAASTIKKGASKIAEWLGIKSNKSLLK